MDCEKLVADGTYKKEDLNEKHRAFIGGMEFARDLAFDRCFDDGDFDSFSPTLTAIQKEVADEVVRAIKEYLNTMICDCIVSLADEEECEREKRVCGTHTPHPSAKPTPSPQGEGLGGAEE